MTVETGEIHIITKECIRTKDPNNNSDTETGTLSSTGLLDMEINQLQTCRKLPSKSQVFQTNEAQLLFTLISRFCWGYHSDKLVSVSQPKRVKVCLSSSSPILFSILGCLWNLWHLAMARERRKEGGTCLDLTTANGSYPLNPGTDVSPIRVIAGTSSL